PSGEISRQFSGGANGFTGSSSKGWPFSTRKARTLRTKGEALAPRMTIDMRLLPGARRILQRRAPRGKLQRRRRTRAAGAAGARRIRPLRSIATTTGVTSRSSSATSRTAAISSPSVRPDPRRVPTRRSVAAGADGPREIGLGHRAAPGKSQLPLADAELLLGALFNRTIGIAGTLGVRVRQAAFLA